MTRAKDPGSERTSYDGLIKAAIRRFPVELTAWIVGDRPRAVESVDTGISIASSRLADKLLRLRFDTRPDILLHVEFQVEGDPDMPRRMLLYLAHILSLEEAAQESVRPACVVIYLDRRTYRPDPGTLEIDGELGFKLLFRYRVLRLWEQDPVPVLEEGGPALWPFVPLMAGNPLKLLIKSQEKIARAPESLIPAEARRELLTVLAGLSLRVIDDRDLARKLFSEIRLMGDNYFFDVIREEGEAIGLVKGRDEGRAEGEAQGRAAEARSNILLILEERFGSAPQEVGGRLDAIQEIADLEALLRTAVAAPTLDAFRVRLEATGPGSPGESKRKEEE